jgi:ribonuclease P protein component, eubacterial
LNGPHTFRKEERISSKKEIDFLFENGTSFISYPLRIVFCEKEASASAQFSVLISVSKRKFKRAVKRNRVKRLIREAYRLNKSILTSALSLNIGFIFVGHDIPDFKQIESAMIKALSLITEKTSRIETDPSSDEKLV